MGNERNFVRPPLLIIPEDDEIEIVEINTPVNSPAVFETPISPNDRQWTSIVRNTEPQGGYRQR